MSKVIRFEFQVPNPEESIQFYSKNFGWQFEKIPTPVDYWLIQTGATDIPGIDGGLMKSPDGNTRTTNLLDVPSIDLAIKGIEQDGGQVVVPKTTVPNMGYFAYCLDNQGLLFGLSEEDKEA